MRFNALILEEKKSGTLSSSVQELSHTDLPEGDVLIQVAYSSVNYKDALASQKNTGVVKKYPLIPGIDLSGTVLESTHTDLKKGQNVLVTGYGLGVSHYGGFSQVARVPAAWVVPLPHNLSLKEAMILGTAGLTAALAINALERQGLRQNKEAKILVTGASGGVGSLGIGILKQLGYQNITALSRKKDTAAAFFQALGVKEVVTLAEITPSKPGALMPQRFDYVLDTVGGTQLETIIPQVSYGGSLSLCGNAGGLTFSATVLPYILRGVSLLGIDSVNLSKEHRLYIWNRLASDMKPDNLAQFVKAELQLTDLPLAFDELLTGKMTGRFLVNTLC